MFVLRKNQRVCKRANALSDFAEDGVGGFLASYPEIGRRNDSAASDNFVSQTDLVVELKRSRLHGEGAGGCARLGSFVDDSDADFHLSEPEREDQTGWASTDDENICVASLWRGRHWAFHANARSIVR